MVMAPTQLSNNSAASRRKRPTRSTGQTKIDEHVEPVLLGDSNGVKKSRGPAIRKTASASSSLTSVAPRRGRSAATALEQSLEPEETVVTSTLRVGKRKKPTTSKETEKIIVEDDSEPNNMGEEEEDDGFAFRRKLPRSAKSKPASSATTKQSTQKSTEEPVKASKGTKKTAEEQPVKATKSTKTTKSKKLKQIDTTNEPALNNGYPSNHMDAHNGDLLDDREVAASLPKAKKVTKKRVTRKAKATSAKDSVTGSSNKPMANGTEASEDHNELQKLPEPPKHKSHNPFINQPVPDHTTSAYHNTSFQHPLVGEFLDELNGKPLYSPGAITPPPIVAKSQQISLPLSDTPIIRKNQEMRKKKSGVRRSSLGNRGKRASSIGNGFVAVPHSAVNPKEFYKHLDADMPEPHRMKQLLLWSLKRVMETQEEAFNQVKVNPTVSVEDKTAINVARFIQEEIVRDVAEGRINTSWWNRPENSDLTETVKKPNVQNVTNQRNFEAFEKRYNELLKEQEQWKNRLDEVRKAADELLSSSPLPKSKPDKSEILKDYPMLESLESEITSSTALNKLQDSLAEMEQEVDRLDDFTHRAGAVSKAATIFSSNQMSRLSQRLSKSRQVKLDPDESILSSLVQASDAHKKEPETEQEHHVPPLGIATSDGVPIRDILRTITRLERNTPSP